MTYNSEPHLMRDMVYDAEQEHLLIQNGINPRIAKAVVNQTRMESLNEITKQARERASSNDSNN
tara:strand:+ start:152 stop:343 length:192 start_codon:yes stop_codon:yes gene_type:complete